MQQKEMYNPSAAGCGFLGYLTGWYGIMRLDF